MSKRKAVLTKLTMVKYCSGAALAGWLSAAGGAVVVQPRAGEAVGPTPAADAASTQGRGR